MSPFWANLQKIFLYKIIPCSVKMPSLAQMGHGWPLNFFITNRFSLRQLLCRHQCLVRLLFHNKNFFLLFLFLFGKSLPIFASLMLKREAFAMKLQILKILLLIGFALPARYAFYKTFF
jgi:hypothetical protein